jgi:hypothetical protein
MRTSKAEKAWNKTINDNNNIKYNLDNQGYSIITADQIKEATKDFKASSETEIRLLNNYWNSPRIVDGKSFGGFPLSRNTWIIGNVDIFEKLSYNKVAITIEPPILNISSLETLHIGGIHTETQMFSYLLACEIFDSIFNDIFKPTLGGKMNSGKFIFSTPIIGFNKNAEFSVNDAQLEIDQCIEGKEHVIIFEGKSAPKKIFNIRQLYYPFRYISKHTTKQIYVGFCALSKNKNIINVFIYEFKDKNNINSLSLYGIYNIKVNKPEQTSYMNIGF